MASSVRRIGTSLVALGLDPRRLLASLRFLPRYLLDLASFRRQLGPDRGSFPIRLFPILSDRYMPGGTAKGHYFHQDLWAARHVFEARPQDHLDVGSRVDGFIAHLLCFRSVQVLDVRDMPSKVRGLSFRQADMMAAPPPGLQADSVSCLHALEHFGLGRYGDPVDAQGWHKGLRNLAGLVKEGGRLYLSVPVGTQAVEFNAQRIFDPATLPAAAAALGLRLVEFSFVDDAGDFHERQDPAAAHCTYGCGCYLFEKRGG